MPQFLDLVAANDPMRARTAVTKRGMQLLVNPEDICGLRETTEVANTLRMLGWDERVAEEEAGDTCPSLVGITLRHGPTIWAFHDLDDILRAIAFLREHQDVLAVQADDLPSPSVTARPRVAA